MKIALAVEGTRGDVYPMLALAKRLEQAGHESVVLGPPEFAAVASERGVAFRGAGSPIRSYLTEHAEVLAGRGPRTLRAQMRFMQESIAQQFAAVPEASADADLILGAGVQLAASSAAELHGVPYRYVMYCPAMLRSAEHPPALFSTSGQRRRLNRCLWWAMDRFALPAMARALNAPRAALGLPPVDDPQRCLLSERPILAADSALAPVPPDTPRASEQIGYLHDLEAPPLPEKLESFLTSGSPPVYFGFGSMTDARPEQTTRLLLEAARRAGFRALISQGWAGLGEGALPADAMSVGTLSHEKLFPRVAAVVHHGGAGTTTAAARAGVPQLVVPHLVDQYYWQSRVEQLGLGPRVPRRRRLSVESLANALTACRDNELLVDRARALGETLRGALAPEADVQRLLRL